MLSNFKRGKITYRRYPVKFVDFSVECKNYLMRNKILLIIINIIFLFLSFRLADASFTIEDEKKLGKEFYENLEKNDVLYHNLRVDEYITKLGRNIVSTMPKSPFEYRFSVIKSAAINAFATPGGYVYVNMGLINLVENESELAGVLSHEIAHINARHIADIVDKSKKINIATLAAILAGAFLGGGGDVAAAVTSFSMATATTLSLKYSREHEEEADRLGMSYMTKAGYDGSSMLDFLKIMRQYEYYSSKIPSYFLTHPGTDDRIRYIDALLQTRYESKGVKSLFGQLKRIQMLLMFELKTPDANLKFFQSALERKGDDLDYLYGLAITQERLGLTAQSLENFHKALKLAPGDGDILQDLGIAYFNSGQPVEAIGYLRKALKAEENNTKASLYLGKSYEAAGDYKSALEIYKNLEKKNTADIEVYYNLAAAYGKTNSSGESHYYFGIYFMKKNKQESAFFHFKEALKYFPPDSPQAKDMESRMKSPNQIVKDAPDHPKNKKR